ncbi:MAG TPA: hypothetical protein PKI03_03775 [Pseudomonadota bacterium]|nr:hypothetical protein [Pseudomonadota bacterium]
MATESEIKVKGFKRINFFKGFLTTEHDWNDAERYHIDKRRLHNRLMHAPGVVFGYTGDLKVVARARGDLSVEIQPGYAVDGQGRDLMLWDAEIKTLVLEEYKLPQTVYIVLRYYEQETDFIAYKENAAYKGHRRILEGCKVEISQTSPDIREEIELGRILLDRNATRIRDARDPNDPKANEIDLRYVPRAGVIGSWLDPTLRIKLSILLERLRRMLLAMARDSKVGTAHDALAGVVSAQTLHTADLLDNRNGHEVLNMLAALQDELVKDVEVNHPQLGQKKEFGNYKKQLDILKGLLSERRNTPEALDNMLVYLAKAGEELAPLYAMGEAAETLAPTPAPNQAAPAPAAPADGGKAAPAAAAKPRGQYGPTEIPPDDMERIKGISSQDLPMELEINGETWIRIDMIKVMDTDSEGSHDLKINEARDSYRSRQKLKYPNGDVIEDVGRAHVGGHVTYKVKGVTPGKRLLIVRRMDYVYGDYSLEFDVDGKKAGVCECPGTDRIHRWRNWPFIIGDEFIVRNEPTVKQIAVTAGRDINMFRYWFYQPR